MATKEQIIKIHVAKAKLNLAEEEYRRILSEYNVTSSTELEINEAEDLLSLFKKMGWQPRSKRTGGVNDRTKQYGFGANKYENLRYRDSKYPKPQKLRKIEALWRNKSRDKSDESLRKFIKRIVKVDDITFLTEYQARKIIKALENF
jgi:hypothetical protein